MKKILVAVLSLTAALMLFLPASTHAAATNSSLRLILDGNQLEPAVSPYAVKGTTMVPLRIITESLGATLQWDKSEPNKVTVRKGAMTIVLRGNSTTGYVNGEKVTLPAAPVFASGTTMLPVRFLAERFDFTVAWDNARYAVVLTSNPKVEPPVDEEPADPSELLSLVSLEDQFVVSAAGPLKPSVYTLTNPDRVVIDLKNAAFGASLPEPENGQMGTLASNHPFVTGIRYAMNDPMTSTIRIVLETDGSAAFELKSKPGDNNVLLAVSKAPLKKKLVVIDAGHGDQDPGAKSVTGKYEKNFNLAMATKVAALLRQEPTIEVQMTRSDDTFVTLDNRAAFANNLKADVFVSIHGNSYTSSSNGTQTYYYNSYSKAFADIMHKHLVAATGFRDDKVRKEDFRVVKKTNMPAVLLEIGYLSNRTEEAQMFTPAFQDRVAAGIVAGIKEYLK